MLIFMASQTAGDIEHVVDEILDYQVDGIIAASVALSSDLSARCLAEGVPMVLFTARQSMCSIDERGRIGELLERKGMFMNHKNQYRLYTEEKLCVRRRRGRKRARGTRTPMPVALRLGERPSR